MLLGLQDYVLLDRQERDRRVGEPAWKRDAGVREESEGREGEPCRKITGWGGAPMKRGEVKEAGERRRSREGKREERSHFNVLPEPSRAEEPKIR